jgi:hypothetical protein
MIVLVFGQALLLVEIEQAVGFVSWRRLVKTTRFLGAALVRAAR